MLHAILQHIWHFRQCGSGDLTSSQIELLDDILGRWGTMYELGLHQSSLTNKSLPRTLELDATALSQFAYFTLHADMQYPKPTPLTHSIADVASAIEIQGLGIPRPWCNSKAARYSLQVLLGIFNSGFVWRNKILTGASSLQLHIVSSLECCKFDFSASLSRTDCCRPIFK